MYLSPGLRVLEERLGLLISILRSTIPLRPICSENFSFVLLLSFSSTVSILSTTFSATDSTSFGFSGSLTLLGLLDTTSGRQLDPFDTISSSVFCVSSYVLMKFTPGIFLRRVFGGIFSLVSTMQLKLRPSYVLAKFFPGNVRFFPLPLRGRTRGSCVLTKFFLPGAGH